MIYSKLSEHQQNELANLIYRDEVDEVFKYINSILTKNSLGLDTCAKPMAVRNKQEMNNDCFAQGYLEKVLEFMEETLAREKPLDTVIKTRQYIQNVIEEIKTFFK